MTRSDVTVATMTLARDAGEEQLLRGALSRLARHEMPVVIADGGSTETFLHFAGHELPGCRLAPPDGTTGLVAQIKRSMRAAAALGSSFVLYTEPDKLDFFDRHLEAFIAAAPADGDVGVVLASRSEASFQTFPPLQRLTEQSINRLCVEIIGAEADYSYGPFLMHRKLVPFVLDIGVDVGWGWRHFVFGAASRLSYRVQHVGGDFECPPDQRQENPSERLHRIRQLGENVQGLLLSQSDRAA